MTHQILQQTVVLAFTIAFASWNEAAHGQESNEPRRQGRRAEILKRLDANGDGILQPNEIPDRAKPILRRAAERSGIAPGEPITLEKLVLRPPNAKDSADRNGRRVAADPPKPSQSGDRRKSGSSEAETPSGKPTAVPGFGEKQQFPPVPGFDAPPDVENSKLKGIRPTASGTASALALKNVSRQANRAAKHSAAGKSIAARTRKYARGLIQKYDKNKDGVLQSDEVENVRFDVRKADRNSNGTITLDELTASLMDKSSGSDGKWKTDSKRASSRDKPTESRSDNSGDLRDSSHEKPDRRADRRRNRRDRDHNQRAGHQKRWLHEHDHDHDGQVAMSEFTSRWTASKVAEFERFDTNGDGLVTQEEAE